MYNRISITLGAIAILALCTPVISLAADKEKPAADVTAAAEKPAGESSGKPVPYRGKVSSVDASAKTFSIKGREKERVFNITDSTKITREGTAADLAAIAAGEEVRGQAAKNGDKWDAVSVMIGAKPASEKKEAKASAKAEDAKAGQ